MPSDGTTNGRPAGRKRTAPPVLILRDRHDHEYRED
jgi:hypothetical protein